MNSNLDPPAAPFVNNGKEVSNNSVVQETKNVPGCCPAQKVKMKDNDRNYVEVLAMLESGFNSSFISKNVKEKLGLSGPKVHLTMNLAVGQKRSEESELVNITVVSISDEAIQKSLQVYAIQTMKSSNEYIELRNEEINVKKILAVINATNMQLQKESLIKSGLPGFEP